MEDVAWITERGDDVELVRVVAIFDQAADEVIPEAALGHLPFAAEQISSWRIEGDLGQFISAIYGGCVGTLLKDGTYTLESTTRVVPGVFERACTQALQRSELFRQSKIKSDDFEEQLGRAFKYFAACEVMSGAVLEESAFTSLPHILESSADLECIIELAGRHFYKQAAQVLRAFLEGQVVDLELAENQKSFADWKRGEYRVPHLRGRDGLLFKLEGKGTLGSKLRSRIEAAYEDLNAFVHGAEQTLIHSGLFVGEHTGHEFRADKFNQWISQFADVTDICLRLTKLKTEIWLRAFKGDEKKCETCRESTLSDLRTFVFGGHEFVQRRCQKCGKECTMRKETGARVYVVSEHLQGQKI
jgi:hypothetical protein